MKGLIAAATTAAFLVPAVVFADEPATTPEPPAQAAPTTPRPESVTLRNGCRELFTQRQFKRYARKVYRRNTISKRAHRQIVTMRRCQHSPKAERNMRAKQHQFAAARRYRAQMASLTPYVGPDGRRWAIPWDIVACESGGNWRAANPSGAVGPYQLLGWGAPYPATTPAARLANHRIAARVWNGGRGRSNWVC